MSKSEKAGKAEKPVIVGISNEVAEQQGQTEPPPDVLAEIQERIVRTIKDQAWQTFCSRLGDAQRRFREVLSRAYGRRIDEKGPGIEAERRLLLGFLMGDLTKEEVWAKAHDLRREILDEQVRIWEQKKP